jgi:hypothetical protein
LNGVNPDLSAVDAVGFMEGIEELYNAGPVKGRISTVSDIER